MANYHVSKDKERNEWRITREGSERISGFASSQKEAEQIAKQYSANSGGGEVRIHGSDGKIRDSNSVKPGKVQFPPRDKKH